MQRTHLGLLLALVWSTASSEPEWPELLDVDLSYRYSSPLQDTNPWGVRLGLGVEVEPTYQGSDKTDTEIDPFLVVSYRADWGNIFLAGDGLGYSRMLTDNFGILLQLEDEDAREDGDDDRLVGLAQEEELELEITGRYFLGPWNFGASLAPATGDKGVVWFLGAGRTWQQDRLLVTVNADLSGSDKDNQRTDFGITPELSTASGFPVYEPDGGLKSFGLRLNAEYKLSPNWFFYGQVDYEKLLGDVADSPLVFDDHQIEAGFGFYYRF